MVRKHKIVQLQLLATGLECYPPTGIAKAADKAMDSLRRMRAGMKADQTISKNEEGISNLFNTKKRKLEKRVTLRHVG